MLGQHHSSDCDSSASESLQAAAATLDSPMLINDSIKRKDNNLTPDSSDDADSLSDTQSTRSKAVLSPTASPTSSPSTSSSSNTLASLNTSSGRPSNRSSPAFAPSAAVTLAKAPGGSEESADVALAGELAQLTIATNPAAAAAVAATSAHAPTSPVMSATTNVAAAQSPSQSVNRGEPDPKKLFVSNLSFDTTPDDVETVFKAFGEVEIRLQSDPYTGRSKGFAFVAFGTPDAAARAKATCEGQPLKGRCIRIEYAVQKYDKPQSGFSAGLKRIERPGRSAIIQQLMKEGGRRNGGGNQFTGPMGAQQRFGHGANPNQNQVNAAANTNSDDEDPIFNNGRNSQRHHSNFRDGHHESPSASAPNAHPLTSAYSNSSGSLSQHASNSPTGNSSNSHRLHSRHHHTNSGGSSNSDAAGAGYPVDYTQAYAYPPNNAYAYVRPTLSHYIPATNYAANTANAAYGRVSHHQNAYSYDGRFGVPLGLPLLYHPAAAAAVHQHAVAVQTAAAMSSAAANSLSQNDLSGGAFNGITFPDSPLRSPNVANAVAVTNSPPATPLPPASGSPILHGSGGELLPSAISLNANLYSAAVAAATASMPISYHHPNMAQNTSHHIPIYPAPPFASAP